MLKRPYKCKSICPFLMLKSSSFICHIRNDFQNDIPNANAMQNYAPIEHQHRLR